MKVMILGEMATPGAVARALDAARAKKRISIVLHSGPSMAASAAEKWANDNNVLFADIDARGGTVGIFAIADSIIAFPGTSKVFLEMAADLGVKVWEPYKPQSDC